MTALATEKISTKAHQRERALARQLGRLHAACHGQSGCFSPDAPLFYGCFGKTLEYDPWMLTEIHASAIGDGDEAVRSTLVAHAAALELKICEDRANFDRTLTSGDRTETYSAQAELMLDSALGIALLQEIQHAVDEEIGSGRMETAKHWTGFKNRVHGFVTEAKKLLAESEWRRAEALSKTLTDRPQEDPRQRQLEALKQVKQEIREAKRRTRVRQERIRLKARFPSRTETLAALLVVAAVVWLATVGMARFLADPVKSVRLADFATAGGLLEAVSRPPSLYVTVHGPTWESFDGTVQSRIVRSVSAVLLERGYRGAWFKTEEGRPVAQWLRGEGAQLILARESTVPGSAAEKTEFSVDLSPARSRAE